MKPKAELLLQQRMILSLISMVLLGTSGHTQGILNS